MCCWLLQLGGSVSRDFLPLFFHDLNPPGPLINRLEYFQILFWFRQDIGIFKKLCRVHPIRTNERLWANRSGPSWEMSNSEWFAQVAHDKWGYRTKNERMSELLVFFERIAHFLRKKRVIRSGNQWANSQPCPSWSQSRRRTSHCYVNLRSVHHTTESSVPNLEKQNSVVCIALRSQSLRYASHCEVRRHTAESNSTPRSQTAHRGVKIKVFDYLWLLRTRFEEVKC